jgi:hypothetical protein
VVDLAVASNLTAIQNDVAILLGGVGFVQISFHCPQ